MLGGLLALVAAATFALQNASVRRGVLSGSVAQAMAITVPIGVPIFFLCALAAGSLGLLASFSSWGIVYLATAGILHFVWGRYCNFRATKAIGANLVAPVQQTSLIVTLVLAVLVLGESLTPLRVLGIVLVLVGPALTWRGTGDAPPVAAADTGLKQPKPFRPAYAEGYLFGLLSATGYGVSPILVRLGLEDKGIGAGLAGGLIAYVAATAALGVILLWPGQLRHVRGVNPEAAKWFTFTGIMVSVSQAFLYTAYAIAPASVVAPIQRLSIVFRLYAARLLNPQHEVFGGRVIVGTVVSLLGMLALSVSSDAVLSLVRLPDSIAGIVGWRWP